MPAIRSCSSLVIRCFKHVEAFADWLTGAAGPWFVAICWSLTLLGGFAFFDVLVLHQPATLLRAILFPFAGLIAINLYASYYRVTTTDPGNPLVVLDDVRIHAPWMIRRSSADEARSGRMRSCGKCGGPKPVRTHHCSVCKRCVLLMDHHCPWINQCVGLYNIRYFLLFMTWLSLGCWTVVLVGYDSFWQSMNHQAEWQSYTPPIAFTLIYILGAAIGIAVPVLLSWHLILVARGETSIEAHDNDYFANKAKQQGLRYVNPYDCGWQTNLQLCFNVGPGRLPYYTLLLPLRYPPASTGWRYPLHAAATGRDVPGVVVGDDGDELTDDEGGGGGWWVADS
ncbi:hypothetical protein NliqN6_6522 [Naganishia liquefaciens]|uniref:Palmitoyltransferase n=1 Tax=Naganishia liquefaciens TaxID=104408 RepID=A0A8H3U099_9TREE|nr:hypothetical protein NliqN6_6522 [Naganishia liquefaciens]